MANRTTLQEALGELNEYEEKYAPPEIFYEGNLSLLYEGRRVSIVGSRNVSAEGVARAKILTQELVRHDIVVVSGLAKGVDTVAHTTAIEMGGKTIAVLGTPLNQAYPKSNTELLDLIKKNHLALSQFPTGYPSLPKNFPIRNRTMALISDATIIVEASEKSGTRHQGWEALRLNRQVYLLENIVNDKNLSWPKEMMGYGAQILTRKNLEDVILDIPFLTEREDFAF